MTNPEWKSWEGRTVEGKFPLQQWLGGSDHSAVFLTQLPGVQSQRTAIKLVVGDSPWIEHQLEHVRAAIKLSHPHLIRLLEAGRCQMDKTTALFIVMEVADDDLSQILPQRPLDSTEMGELLPPVIDALAYLHDTGLVHGRIKPSNVLAVGNQLKLSSDQVAPVEDQDSNRRRRDAFDAPETAAGIISPAGDVWSVGVLIVAALTQNVAVAEEASPGNRNLPETIREPFRGIVRECLHLDPKRRCSLKEIQSRLQPEARSVPAPTEPPPAPPSSPYRYSWRMFIPIAVLIVFAVGWGLYRMIFPSVPQKSEPNTQVVEPKVTLTPASPTPTDAPKAELPKAPTSSPGSVLHQVLPDPPKSAMNTITGTIKIAIRVEVDASGKVTDSQFKTRGSSNYFANQAMDAARRWEFAPPQANGQPTASAWLLQFRFKRGSIQVSPQQLKR